MALPLTPVIGAGAEQKEEQIWPEFDAYYRLKPNARLFFLVAPTREVENGQVSDIDELQVGAHVELGVLPIARAHHDSTRYDADRMKYLRFRTGLRYSESPGDPDSDEWRIVADLTPRAVLPLDVHLGFRNEIDLRWIDEEFSWRYRPRLWLERDFNIGQRHLALVPFGSVEFFWDSRSDDWVRTLYKLGTAIAVKPWFAPQVYWGHQVDDHSGSDTIIDTLGITLKFFF